MNSTEFEDLLQAPAPEPTPLDNNRGGDVNEDMVVDNDEESDHDGEEPEGAPIDDDNDSVVDDENIPAVLGNKVHAEQPRDDYVDAEVDIPDLDEVATQEDVIIENDDSGMVNLDIPPDNILPEGSKRWRISRRRHIEDGYHLTNVTNDISDTTTATNKYLNAMVVYMESHSTFAQLINLLQFAADHLLLTQLGMKAGIKAFGQKGVNAVVKEMQQFHDREVVTPLEPHDITPEVRKRALGYLMFLKKKRNGDIKGRGCADGRPQRVYKSKLETSSPTVCPESIFIGCAMNAKEKRDVAHVDIPRAFLQTPASDGTIIKLQGVLVMTLVKVNPSWDRFVVYEGKKRTPTIYSRAIKALYGTVDAAKLFYDSLSLLLVDQLKFIKSPYNSCIVNKMVNGS